MISRVGVLLAGAAVVLGACGGVAEVAGPAPGTSTPPVSVGTPTQLPTPVATVSSPAQTQPKPAAPPARPAAPAARPPASAPAPPAAAPPPGKDYPTAGVACEDGLESVDELGALGADCDTARRVATAVDKKILLLGEVPLEPFQAVDGWVCAKDARQMEEYVYIACDKGDPRMESVTFGWGT